MCLLGSRPAHVQLSLRAHEPLKKLLLFHFKLQQNGLNPNMETDTKCEKWYIQQLWQIYIVAKCSKKITLLSNVLTIQTRKEKMVATLYPNIKNSRVKGAHYSHDLAISLEQEDNDEKCAIKYYLFFWETRKCQMKCHEPSIFFIS